MRKRQNKCLRCGELIIGRRSSAKYCKRCGRIRSHIPEKPKAYQKIT